ncbi:NUDIX hydrolase [Compostimonas suwonensis]|uniref:ADP-ribose pyrophosphatase YjhB (NUDIX family) n=1 Tax=Compostimonas suwonensis TaxID=1048394 RepID=A0A2M9BB08_9MICO|nr:NUDIX hydrolase [Compostimonas suwonensis]PJJ55121.1 ADP-ribose pyrophosphatase YjhB (NUDIX family) [Compostimonas suwonensis]
MDDLRPSGPPHRPRDSGDAWVEGPDGRRYWGRFGAAGLLAHDPEAGVLLQHRAEWSHFGGTWGLPGGARHGGESAVDAAFREAREEAGVDPARLRVRTLTVLDLGIWSYSTVVADVTEPFEATIGDPESIELRWVPVSEVEGYPLHPGFAASWPALRAGLGRGILLVVDSANVLGSRPTGWWRDRAGATERLAGELQAALDEGLPADFDASPTLAWPRTVLVVEGEAKAAQPRLAPPHGRAALTIARAEHDGDQAIVDLVERARDDGSLTAVHVVTADRELGRRVSELGAHLAGPSWLLSRMDAARGR